MKKFITFAVNNPVTILMMVLAIMLLGKISYDKLSVDLLPDLNNPKLFVDIQTGEKPPEEVEKQFVERMESMAIRQRDVTTVSSIIKAGSAQIAVEYAWNKDMDEAFLDLQKAMNSFAQNDEIEELQISQNDPNTDPVILIGMSHQNITNMADLRKVADSYVRNELVRVDGVADVVLSGDEVSNLIVRTDPYKLDAYGLNINTLSSKIQEENQRISGGRVTEMGTQYIVSGVNMLDTEVDFGNIIVGYKQTETDGGGSVVGDTHCFVELFLLILYDFKTDAQGGILRVMDITVAGAEIPDVDLGLVGRTDFLGEIQKHSFKKLPAGDL